MKARTNFTIDKDVLVRFKKLVPNMSEEVEDFMRRRSVELSGAGEDHEARYEDLKKEYNALSGKVARKKKELEGEPHFQKANELLSQLGLKKDFSNATELIPKLISAWKGPSDFLQEYITLVELARDKREVERELTQIRSQVPGSTPATDEVVVSDSLPPKTAERFECTAIMPVQN